MLTVAEIIDGVGLPAGAVSILPMTRELGDRMVADERFKLLTFTGSPSVGWRMKERAGKKKVVLELGGNAGVIIDKTADLDWAVKRILVGALQLRGPGVHQRPAHVRARGRPRRRSSSSSSRASSALQLGDPLDPTTRRRADGRRRRPPRGPSAGSTRPSSSAARSSPAARPTAPSSSRPSSTTSRSRPRSARTRPLPRSSSSSRSPTSTTRSGRSTTASSGCRPASSRTTSPTPGRRSTSSRSAASIINDVPTYRIDHMPYGGVKDSGLGPRGSALVDRGHDRAPDHGAGPAAVASVDMAAGGSAMAASVPSAFL